jgi:hypothetical protein
MCLETYVRPSVRARDLFKIKYCCRSQTMWLSEVLQHLPAQLLLVKTQARISSLQPMESLTTCFNFKVFASNFWQRLQKCRTVRLSDFAFVQSLRETRSAAIYMGIRGSCGGGGGRAFERVLLGGQAPKRPFNEEREKVSHASRSERGRARTCAALLHAS